MESNSRVDLTVPLGLKRVDMTSWRKNFGAPFGSSVTSDENRAAYCVHQDAEASVDSKARKSNLADSFGINKDP
jgi:hypothetical protein